ncbi:MAG: hypothetical protein NTY09_09250 [bacterium]|nr:hypothetical protein [bacterium]
MIPYLRMLCFAVLVGMIISGCSGRNSQPITPDEFAPQQALTGSPDAVNDQTGNHYLLAYNFIYVDPYSPDGPKFEVIPVRQGVFHLNVLKFLEVSPCTDCFKVVGFYYPEHGKLGIDIQIEHPWTELDKSVFDVRAIIMFNGSHEFPICGKSTSDPALGDGAVLNPDGYTALYNGSTITAPVGGYQKYFPGKQATLVVPDSDINGYKCFMTDGPWNNRNAFYAGSSDVNSFSLQLPAWPFLIGYAVDVSRMPPITMPVDDPMTDFGIGANCTEPWKVYVNEEPVENGLTDTGGQTKLIIDVYDWQGKSTYYVPVVECPEIFNGLLAGTWVSDGAGYARYEVTISNEHMASVGNYMCLIGVEAKENDPINFPWLDLTAYQIISLEVTKGE